MNDNNGRRGGGARDFVAGFLLGGAVFGALGYLLAPQVYMCHCCFLYLDKSVLNWELVIFHHFKW